MFRGRTDAAPCDPKWLDLLCDAACFCAKSSVDLDPMAVRNKVLPALKFTSISDFVRCIGKVAKMETLPQGQKNPFLTDPSRAILSTAMLARACEPLEMREKKPLMLDGARAIGGKFAERPAGARVCN